MATWEDGPEYAPLERPDAFDAPSLTGADLEPPPAAPPQPPVPLARPVFADPQQPVPSLVDLVPAPPAPRDPSTPFDVVASVVTADSSAWAAAHWSPPPAAPPPQAAPFQPVPLQPAPQGPEAQWPAPPWPTSASSAPQFPPAHPPAQFPPTQPPTNGSFPEPGTPQWFVPGPGYQQPPVQPTPPTVRAVLAAVTPGLAISLLIGGLIWTLAPVTVVVAYLLASRMTYGRTPTRTVFGIVLALLGAVALLALVSADGLFSRWWGTLAGWACFGSWALLVTAVIAASRALKQGRPDPLLPSRRSPR